MVQINEQNNDFGRWCFTCLVSKAITNATVFWSIDIYHEAKLVYAKNPALKMETEMISLTAA